MVQSSKNRSSLNKTEANYVMLGTPFRKLYLKQVLRLELDKKGEYLVPQVKQVYEDIIKQIDALEVSDLIKNESLQKTLKKEIEYLALEQIDEFLNTIAGIEKKYHSLYLEELEKLKTYVLNNLKKTIKIFRKLN